MIVNGYSRFMTCGGLNYFSKKEEKGYSQIVCTDEQLTNKDIEYMTENGMTLSKEMIAKIKRKNQVKP